MSVNEIFYMEEIRNKGNDLSFSHFRLQWSLHALLQNQQILDKKLNVLVSILRPVIDLSRPVGNRVDCTDFKGDAKQKKESDARNPLR